MSTAHHSVADAGSGADSNNLINHAAKGISYFTPAQIPPAGTALEQPDGKPIPKLFQPIKIRGVTFQNRVVLSPLCQYSCRDGHFTSWHLAHLGGIISRGPGLAFIEATSVTPQGRITPEDSGIWQDSQVEKLKTVVEFAHSQGQKIGIQLAHAGRKASTVAPWLSTGAVAGDNPEQLGWPDDVWGPSAIPFNEHHATPKALSLDQIEEFKQAWVAGVRRALKAGFDVIEIHNAHGYLLHSFLSPVSNQRTDKYGGSFENRVRLTLEIVELTRKEIPEDMPLFLRISSTDYLEEVPEIKESWTVDDTAKLAEILATKGVDFLDVSGGGNHPLQRPHTGPAYQSPAAKKVKERVGDKLLVGSVGSITTGEMANGLLEDGLDMVFAGRTFQKNPGLVWQWADELGVQVNWANQIRWGFGGRGGKKKEEK